MGRSCRKVFEEFGGGVCAEERSGGGGFVAPLGSIAERVLTSCFVMRFANTVASSCFTLVETAAVRTGVGAVIPPDMLCNPTGALPFQMSSKSSFWC